MNKKIPTILSLVFLLAILVAIPFTVRLSQQRQEIRIKAAPATTLRFFPSTSTKIINEVFNIGVEVDTGSNAIYGADLEILFDPTILQAQSVKAGSFLDSPQELANNIDNLTGKIIYSLGSFSSKTGTGILALISFQAKSGGTSSLSFGPTTSIAAAGEIEGLASTQAGTVDVVDKVSLSFKIKFQGINQQGPNKTADLILKKAGQTAGTYNAVVITADPSGIYSGAISAISPDAYDIFIKGWVHLTKKIAGVSLKNIDNSLDWTGIVLLTGDANGDDLINIQDFGILVADYFTSDSPADFNLDGIVNIQDFRFIAENYLKGGET